MSLRHLRRGGLAADTAARLGHAQGFVRVAVQTGASLVPVLSFGENDLFTTYRPDKASRLAKVQRCACAQTLYTNLIWAMHSHAQHLLRKQAALGAGA